LRLNPLNAELSPICHLLALFEAHHILHVSRIRVKGQETRLTLQEHDDDDDDDVFKINNTFFWDLKPYSLLDRYQCFEELCLLLLHVVLKMQ